MSENLNMELRSDVLERALNLEHLINDCLKMFLKISRDAKTKTLSNKASSISFKTKIDLIFDLEYIDSKQHDSFDKFMNVRNQFMHNAHAKSFCDVTTHIDGLEKWLIKNYPLNAEQQNIINELQEEKKREHSIEFMFHSLNLKLHETIVSMIAEARSHQEKTIHNMIGFRYFGAAYANTDSSIDLIHQRLINALEEQEVTELSIGELRRILNKVRIDLSQKLQDHIDAELPIGTSGRDFIEEHFARIRSESKEENEKAEKSEK